MPNQQQIPAQFSSLGNMGNVVSVHRAKVSVTANTFVSGVFILSSGIALLIALAIGWDRWGSAPSPEILSAILASIHNVRFYQRLVRDARAAIVEDRFEDFRKAFLEAYASR